jgi:hypothetical protein
MMKKLLLIFSFFAMAQLAAADVSTRVCLADGNTPLELADPNVPLVYRPVMLGMKLTIIVSSNDPEACPNGIDLAIADANRDYGVLACRDANETECLGSILPAAGTGAHVAPWIESGIAGFSMYPGVKDVSVGDWFIIDYNPTDVGSCKVGYYDHDVSLTEPVYYIEFTHVPTCDFNNDGIVNFVDFQILASYWQTANCAGPGSCEGADLDGTGIVDGNDLALFAAFWVERTHSWF